ncbi:MAG: epoxide hydrolase N-terminal domain-containing protein, partial [Microvirga sp.]
MSVRKTAEAIDQDRRGLLGTAITAIALAGTASLISANPVGAADSFGNRTSKQKESTVDTTKDIAIRPFSVNFPEEALTDLRRRIAATRWPDKEQVSDETQGVRLATMRNLAQHWQASHDWRRAEARLNAVPQFIT